jgi:hypothetical protein
VGRQDFQVKIRGQRIELGEIEARLGACAGVRDAVVLARTEDGATDGAEEPRLVAYFTAQAGAAPTPAALRNRLAELLPDYMVPAAFVLMTAFPLSPNGKLDRRALPAPDHASFASRAFEAPQGEVECAIAQIWQGLLNIEQVGRHDNFFELGGHSLLAARCMAAIDAQLGITIALRMLFESPTLSQLALKIHTLLALTTAPDPDGLSSADEVIEF